jgi:hypothetical protein
LAVADVDAIEHLGQRLDEVREVDGFGDVERHFGVGARRLGNIVDQPGQAFYVVLNGVGQQLAVVFVLDLGQRLGGAAHRGQRVLEFVRNVGGKSLASIRL